MQCDKDSTYHFRLKMEAGEGAEKCGQPLCARKGKGIDSPLGSSPEGSIALLTLRSLTQEDPCQTSNLQK